MKIDVRRQRLDEFSHWSKEKEHPEYLVARKPPKGTPTIEVLLTEPPKYRINGQIVDVPKGMSPEEYYERYMGRDIFRDEEEENGKSWAVLKNKESDRDIDPGFYRDNKKEESFEGLHPLRKQYLENRLKQIEIHDRQQTMQDNFTTRMYGKKDYTEERHNILQELMQGKQSRTPGYKYPDEKFWDSVDKQNGAEKLPQTPEAVSKEIARFEREYPKEYNRNMQEIENAKKQQLENDKKSWPEINKDIQDGKITPQELSNKQWQTILDKSAEELQNVQGTGTSYCNMYTRDQLLKQGIYMPPGQNANQIKDHMDNNPENWEKLPKKTDAQGNPTGLLDHQAAHDAAKNGDTVVVVWKNPNPSPNEHGHIAQVEGTAEMQPSGKWGNIQVPSINGYNSSDDKIKTESLSWQFTKDKEPGMDYYRYMGEKRDDKVAS